MNKSKKNQLMEKLLDVVDEKLGFLDLLSSTFQDIMEGVEEGFEKIIDEAYKDSFTVNELRKDVMIDSNIESLERLLQDWKDI